MNLDEWVQSMMRVLAHKKKEDYWEIIRKKELKLERKETKFSREGK